MAKHIEKLLDLLPPIVFLIFYWQSNIIKATSALIVSSLLCMMITYILGAKISKINLFSNIILTIFGSITIYSSNPLFIKIKPTIFYLCISVVLIYNLISKKYLIKSLLSQNFQLDDKAYIQLTKQWLCFFIGCASINEYVCLNFSEKTWVYFKCFGVIGMTFALILIQYITLSKKHIKSN